MPKLRFYLSAFAFAFPVFLLFHSCKKAELSSPLSKSSVTVPNEISERKFFDVPADVAPIVKKLADRIEKQNEKYHFIEKLIRKEGYAIWDKTNIIPPVEMEQAIERLTGRRRIQFYSCLWFCQIQLM